MMNSRSMERNMERFRAWREMLEMQRNRELGINRLGDKKLRTSELYKLKCKMFNWNVYVILF